MEKRKVAVIGSGLDSSTLMEMMLSVDNRTDIVLKEDLFPARRAPRSLEHGIEEWLGMRIPGKRIPPAKINTQADLERIERIKNEAEEKRQRKRDKRLSLQKGKMSG